ncbi:MAG: hypothetical protein AB7E47_17505 [Desulfovibrionaceae bacterium]
MLRNIFGVPARLGRWESWTIIWPWSRKGKGLWGQNVAGTPEYFLRLWLLAIPLGLAVAWALGVAWCGWAALAFVAFFVLVHIMTMRHERGHMWRIPDKGCLGGHRWCVMAEEHLVGHADGSWRGKLKLLPYQLAWGWGRYCPACAAKIRQEQACGMGESNCAWLEGWFARRRRWTLAIAVVLAGLSAVVLSVAARAQVQPWMVAAVAAITALWCGLIGWALVERR